MVYRLILAYRGSAYAGWQRQPNALAVQEVVEEALGKIVRRPLHLVGASRTDAGVHARGQAAHLELDRPFSERSLVHGCNHHLPEDIRVMAARRMAEGFHARRHAEWKEYRYRLVRRSVVSPLVAPFAVGVHQPLDRAAMEEATAELVGEHDFTAFALAGGAHTHPRRRILAADWREGGPGGEELVFRVVGVGFLRGMVRSLVGTLLEVGQGRRPAADVRRLLGGRPRSEAGPTAPARGLVLERIHYAERWERPPAAGG